MKLRIDARALEDLRDIHGYIAVHGSATAAEQVRRYLRTRLQRMLTTPRIGMMTDNPDIRIVPPVRYPYRIYYTIRGDNLVILHIRHTARLAPDDVQTGI